MSEWHAYTFVPQSLAEVHDLLRDAWQLRASSSRIELVNPSTSSKPSSGPRTVPTSKMARVTANRV